MMSSDFSPDSPERYAQGGIPAHRAASTINAWGTPVIDGEASGA